MEQTVIATEKAATVLKLLGDKTRLSMVGLLEHDECCVCEFVEMFQMSQPSISQHLRKLRDVGLVREQRKGQWIFYGLNKEHEMYPVVGAILQHIPDQGEKLKGLEREGLRISCCD